MFPANKRVLHKMLLPVKNLVHRSQIDVLLQRNSCYEELMARAPFCDSKACNTT